MPEKLRVLVISGQSPRRLSPAVKTNSSIQRRLDVPDVPGHDRLKIKPYTDSILFLIFVAQDHLQRQPADFSKSVDKDEFVKSAIQTVCLPSIR
jgi:hypothetical protein